MYIERAGILGRVGRRDVRVASGSSVGRRGFQARGTGIRASTGSNAANIVREIEIRASTRSNAANVAANAANIAANIARLNALLSQLQTLANTTSTINETPRSVIQGQFQNIINLAGNIGDTAGVPAKTLNAINVLKFNAQNSFNSINSNFLISFNAARNFLQNFSTLPNALSSGQDWAQNAINISIKNQNSGQIIQAATIYQALADMPTMLKANAAISQTSAIVNQANASIATANASIATANRNVTTLQSQIKTLVQTAQQKQQAYDLTVMKTAMQNAMATQANSDLAVLTKQKTMYENTIAELNKTITTLQGSNATLQNKASNTGMSIGASLLGLMVL
jgi:chromosome segregation ATPase